MAYTPYPGPTYESSGENTSFLASLLPTPVFICKALAIIRHEGLLADGKTYTGDQWTAASVSIVNALEQCGCRLKVEGMNNIYDLKEPCVFIGNHMSTLETFVLPGFIQPYKDVTFVVKESLLTMPYFKHVLASRDPIKVTRSNPRKDLQAVLEGGTERLKNGTSVIIFPQSTRSTTLNAEQFNSIGIKLAKKANVPIVPVALYTEAWGNGVPPLKDFGRVRPKLTIHFKFGEPFRIEGNGKAEHAAVYEFIEQNLTAWKSELFR